MAEGKKKSIDDIDDFCKMTEILKILGISGEGLKTMEAMKEKIKEKCRQSDSEGEGTRSNSKTTGFSVISEAKDEDKKKREILHQIYSNTLRCLAKMDEKALSVLKSEVPKVKKKMLDYQRELLSREYYVLVSGEISAGKSSLLNLILGEDVLPCAVLHTTSTICELKYARERSMVVHSTEQTKRIPLKRPEDCEGKSYNEQISPFVHMKTDRESGPQYQKVEIFWPHEVLKNGIVIIDTPGIGESDAMDQVVMNHFPEAFAFMYVLNTTNAGGVQKDRIIRIFDEVRKRGTAEEKKCLAECALFICNKWDQVAANEKEGVKEYVTQQLKQCWPDVDPESQIVYISTTNAIEMSKYELTHPDYVTLLKCIESMVLKAINARLDQHSVWLDWVLYRIAQQTTIFISNTEIDRHIVVNRMDSIGERMMKIEERQKEAKIDLEKQMLEEFENVISCLSQYLMTAQFQETFTVWTTNDAPTEETTWDLTKGAIKKAIESRFLKLLQKWENECHTFANAHHALVQCFLNKLNVIEEEIQELEEDMIGDKHEIHLQPKGGKKEISTGAKVLAGVTGPLWIPLGVVGLLVSIPVIGIISTGKTMKSKLRLTQYHGDRCRYLQKKSAQYLVSFLRKGAHEYVKKQMKETESVLQEYIERIPRLIEADKKMATQLRDESYSNENVQNIYRPILSEISKIRETLNVFAFNIHHPTIRASELDWKDNTESCLGEGESSAVFRGTFKRTLPVAIKLLKKSLDITNVRIFCTDEQMLRKLKHENVVKFYGTASVTTSLCKGFTAVFVMELCQENLMTAIFKETSKAPAQNYTPEAFQNFFKWATQITDGLKYIHGQKLYHRHLNLENILVSHDGTLKISDIGIRTGTLVTESTIVYYAPEVIRLKSYNFSADLYSFGMILWEMWYGEKVFNEIPRPIEMESLIDKIQDGYRPYTPTAVVSLPKLQGIMQNCWNPKRECRPTACDCYTALVVLFQETHNSNEIYYSTV